MRFLTILSQPLTAPTKRTLIKGSSNDHGGVSRVLSRCQPVTSCRNLDQLSQLGDALRRSLANLDSLMAVRPWILLRVQCR